ncbi:MAG: MBL fold metallo-hydrolase [Defluviitaleaceae bacterium]|nr:MBL fold metallo-hydrolase [Defluviitaleaceae bacterium]
MTLKTMTLTIPVGFAHTNAHICYDDTTREGVLIDPGGEAAKISAKIAERGITIKAILLTHGHLDHIGASDELREALKTEVYTSKKEAALANDQNMNGTAFFRMPPITATIDHFLEDKQELELPCGKIRVLSTPGHTHGHLSYYLPHADILFSGDCLFHESYGRYDLPTGDFAVLRKSLMSLFELPPQTIVYSGHGQATTIEHEIAHNLIHKS